MSTYENLFKASQALSWLFLLLLVWNVTAVVVWIRFRSKFRLLGEMLGGWDRATDGGNGDLKLSRESQLVACAIRLSEIRSSSDRETLLVEMSKLVELLQREPARVDAAGG